MRPGFQRPRRRMEGVSAANVVAVVEQSDARDQEDAAMPGEDHQRVTYSVTDEDIFRFLVYHTLHDPGSWCGFIVGALFLFVFTTSLVSTGFKGTRPSFAAMWGLVAALFFLLTYRWYLRLRARKGKHTLPGSLGEHTVAISPEGLFTSTPLGEGTLKWAAFDRVVGTPDYLYLYVGKSAATIVPRRGFSSSTTA